MMFRTLVAVLFSALFATLTAGPAWAERVYDFNTNTWVSQDAAQPAAQPTTQPAQRAVARSTQNPIPRQLVDYQTTLRPGTIVVETAERRLYLVLEDGKAYRYGIGVGRDGFTFGGTYTITRKAEWPGWTPPPAMRQRQPELPAFMPGGPDNPLGARALYIGNTLFRVHGSNEPWTIGHAVSSGCIRMTNDDVIDLYERVRVGATIVVRR